MLALRGAGSGFAATVKLIVAVPVPLAGIPVIHAVCCCSSNCNWLACLHQTRLCCPRPPGCSWSGSASSCTKPPPPLRYDERLPADHDVCASCMRRLGGNSDIDGGRYQPRFLGTPVTHAGTPLAAIAAARCVDRERARAAGFRRGVALWGPTNSCIRLPA